MGVGAVAGAVIGGFVGANTAVAVGTAISVGFSLGNAHDNYKEAQEMQKELSQSQTYSFGPIRNTKSHEIPIPVVYGRNRVAGNIIYQKVTGEKDRYMDIQVALGEGPVNAITGVKADENSISVDKYLGTRSQSADSVNDQGQTFPYIAYISKTLDAEKLEISGAPTITSIIEGRTIEIWNGSSWVTQYSNNPAYCILDFLTNSRYGLEIDNQYINLDSFKNVASYCNEDVDGENRFELNMVIDSRRSSLDIIQDMLSCFRGFLIYTDGELKLKVDAPEAPVQSFDMDNIIEDSFSYNKTGKDERYNQVIVNYTDPNEHWEKIGAQYSDDSDIEKRDVIKKEIPLIGINRFSQAGREARFFQKKSKYCPTFVSWKAGIDSIHCEVGDVVTVSHDVPEWTGKEFRILQIAEAENDEMEIVGQEYNEAIYSDDGVVEQITKDSDLPNPFEAPDSVTDLSLVENADVLEDGTWSPGIKVSFTQPDYVIWDSAYIYISSDDGATWDFITNISDTEYTIKQLPPDTYKVKVVSKSKQGRKEDFGTANTGQITVSGKDAKPSDVNWGTCDFDRTIILRWQPITDIDLKAYEVRTDTNFGNDDAALVYRGDGLEHEKQNPQQRTYTFYVKALDWSGNYSANYDEITLNNSAPSAPNLTGDDITEFFEAVKIHVPSVSDANGYKVYITPSDGSGNATDPTEIIPLSTAQTINYDLNSGDSVLIKIGSYDSLTSIMDDENISSEYEATAKMIENLAQFAQDIRPPKIVNSLPALPDSDYPVGSTVVLNDDTSADHGKLFRNVDGSWSSAVKTVDLSGQIQEGQIASDAITQTKIAQNAVDTAQIALEAITSEVIAAGEITAEEIASQAVELSKFASGIRPVQIVAGLPALADSNYPPDSVVINSNDGKLYRNVSDSWTTEVPSDDLTGQITETQITDNAISTPKLSAEAVTAAKIAAATITSSKIAADTIEAGNIAAGAIDVDELAANAVVSSKIAADAIVAEKIAAGEIDTEHLKASAVTAAKIAAGAITASEIAADTITASEIASNTITATQIAAETITAAEIESGAITTDKLEALAITASKIAVNAITSGKITADAITTAKIAAGAIGADEIAADEILAKHIGSNEVITETANIKDAIIDDAKIANLEADKLTTTRAKIQSAQIDKIQSEQIYVGDQPASIINPKPEDAQLFHFDRSLISTDGIQPESGAVTTLRPNEGKFGGAVAVEEATTNLITNGDVENDTGGWTTTTFAGSGNFTHDDSGYNSEKSLKIESTSDSSRLVWTTSNVSLLADTIYTISLRVKVSNLTSGSIVIASFPDYTDRTSSYNKLSNTISADTGGWVWLTNTFTVATGQSGDFGFRLWAEFVNNGCEVWFDRMQLEQKSFATSFVNGSRASGVLDYETPINLQGDGHIHFVVKSEKAMSDHDEHSQGGLMSVPADSRSLDMWMLEAGLKFMVKGTSRKILNYQKNTPYTIDITWENSGNIRYYVDGNLEWSSDTVTFDGVSTGVFRVGNYANNSFTNSVLFDELLISPTAHTPEVIQAWYNSQAPFYDNESVIGANNMMMTAEGLFAYDSDGKETIRMGTEYGNATFSGTVKAKSGLVLPVRSNPI